MSAALNGVKSRNSAQTAEEIVRGPVGALLGVSDAAAAALSTLQIGSVFDLATSRVFAAAADLVAVSGNDAARLENRLNAVPSDTVDAPADVAVAELAQQPISILRRIGAASAPAISAALDVVTVRDLALWPPYRGAKDLLAEAFFPEQQLGYDHDAPADLLPRSGNYPTERVFYRRLLIEAVPPDGQPTAIENLSEAIDIAPGLVEPRGFETFATGALLSFSQSWFSQGLTLGQLLHSTSLAPGESTRLAVVDWNRRQRSATSETVSESEQLASTTNHNRALSEVTSAVATEMQSGTSTSTTESSTRSGGSGFGFEAGPLAFGGSSGGSRTSTEVMTASSSFGMRNVSADYAQDINDSTQQNATSARDRRASTVRELSQEEHQQISTRVITNYNHMHALSVQYYEVVQAFKVVTQLERAERCLFVPVKLFDFTKPATIERWRGALARAALTSAAGRMLAEFGAVLATSQLPLRAIVRPVRAVAGLAVGYLTARSFDTSAGSAATASADAPPSTSTEAATTGDSTTPASAPPPAPSSAEADPVPAVVAPSTRIGRMIAAGWDVAQIDEIGRLMGRLLVPTQTNCTYIPEDALLIGVSLRSGTATHFDVRRRDGTVVLVQPNAGEQSNTTDGVSLVSPAEISELTTIALESAVTRSVRTALTLQLSISGAVRTLDIPIELAPGGPRSGLQLCVTFDAGAGMRELIDHLRANALHYTQAVMRSLDGAEVAAMLAQLSYRSLPLAQLVDQKPIAISSNFLVFRMNMPAGNDAGDPHLAEDVRQWKLFLQHAGLAGPEPKTEIVPLPTGGVFGEAVLGRSNAAEKIDLHRFWNWQDSPIPLTPPEIAAVSAESRSRPEAAKPGQLSTPVLSIQAPVALPDPTNIAAVAAAIQNGSMFRDMSGLEQAAAIALAAQKSSAAGATSGLQLAGQNLHTIMDQKTQRMRIAAQLAAQMMGVPVSGDTGSQSAPGKNTPTERGGELNQAARLDAQQASGAPGATAASDVFRATQGFGAQEQALKMAQSLANDDAGAGGSTGAQAPVRTVGPTQSVPQSLLGIFHLSNRFTDPAIFGPTPVKIDARMYNREGQMVWHREEVAQPKLSARFSITHPYLFLELWYEYVLSWPQATRVVTNAHTTLNVPAGATSAEASVYVFLDDKVFIVDAAPTSDDDLKALLLDKGVDLERVVARPTVASRADGRFDVTARTLSVTLDPLFATPA